jgi:translocator protein
MKKKGKTKNKTSLKKKSKSKNISINWKVLLTSFLIVYLVAAIGSFFTSKNTNSEWYESIRPFITPPNYVFPIVWNIIFALIVLALYICWTNALKKQKSAIVISYGINFLLNILWSVFYFYLKNPLMAFIVLIFLWISIASIVYVSYKIKKNAGFLLIPYLVWVSFAGILNYLSI